MEINVLEDCAHADQINSICRDCGLCLDNECLQTPQKTILIRGSRFNVQMKHVFYNPEKINDSAINKILTPLNLTKYKSFVRNMLLDAKFNFRLKKEDKVIVTVYHLLKTLEFPIVIGDLFKFTSTSKYRLLKAHRDTFGYTGVGDEYLKGIFDRTSDLMRKRGLDAHASLEEFIILADKHRCADLKALCLSYFLESNNFSNMLFKDYDGCTVYQLENIRRKLKRSDIG